MSTETTQDATAVTEAVLSVCDPAVKYAHATASGDRDELLAWAPGALGRNSADAVPPTIGDIVQAVSPLLAAARREGKVEGLREAVDTVRDAVAFDYASVAQGRLSNRIAAIEAGGDLS